MRPSISIRVAISLGETLSAKLAAKSIELATRDYAVSLLADLDLAVIADVVVTTVAMDIVPANSFRMTIGSDPPFDCNAHQSFARQVPLELYRRRSTLIIDGAVKALASSVWPDAALTEYSTKKLHQLVEACVARNISQGRLALLLSTVQPAALWDTWELLNRVHSENELGVGIELAPSELASSGDGAADWISVQRRVFRATGLLCPAPRVHNSAELSAGEWRIRINDVRLPPQRLGEDAILECAELLSEDAQAFVTRDGVERSLRLLGQSAPILAKEIVRRLGLNRLVWIVGLLAREGTSLHNFAQVLDDLTGTIVPYEVEQNAFAIIHAPLDTFVERKRGEGRREVTPEDYVSAVQAREGRDAHSKRPRCDDVP